jgi:DNA-directed RNA polymerase specialized sigma24 family protein
MKNYVNNSELLIELNKYKQTKQMSESLGKMVFDIARNVSKKGNFAGYTYKDDMVGEALLTCVKYLHNFDSDKSKNPFAYLTTCCIRSFIVYIKNQHKHSVIKDQLYNCNDGKQLIVDSSIAIDYSDYQVI